MLLAPDEEVSQWLRAAAAAQGLEHAVCRKQHHGDRDVDVALPDHDVAVTHALFVGDALAHLQAAGVRHVWSSGCVPHSSNSVSVVPLLAAAVADCA